MLALSVGLGTLMAAWTCFRLYIDILSLHSEGTIIGKEQKLLGADAPFVLCTFKYISDSEELKGTPVYSGLSSDHKIGDKIYIIIAPWDRRQFFIKGDWMRRAIYLLAAAFLLIVLARR